MFGPSCAARGEAPAEKELSFAGGRRYTVGACARFRGIGTGAGAIPGNDCMAARFRLPAVNILLRRKTRWTSATAQIRRT